ncbi:acetyl-CoA C-acyltransferase [Flexibacterium corallicola]|uniref:acetyl-CoA C-acyltransferase n=1 Tax=Flexibacterium corallicola TaxID=3037259 RepID=UPI00286F58D6|nr:acetyl-CoA C-acyltransferase [Pseudovibrio sp. M1P-2-3]
MQTSSVVICTAKRTPLGAFLGSFSNMQAHQLGAAAIAACLTEPKVDPMQISEVLMGCVLSAGQGQAPARQAVRKAGLPDSIGATTINKVCGSGMKAVMLAHDLLLAGNDGVIIAGGMESMSAAPHLLPHLRLGKKTGSAEVLDHMLTDGLEDAYDKGRPMGEFGEATAAKYGFDRTSQDQYATETLRRAQYAVSEGAFDNECTPVTVSTRKGDIIVNRDERPHQINPVKIPELKAAFGKNGTITPASSSANADGAAALLLAREETALRDGLPILARIVGHAGHSQDPAWFTTAPIPAISKLLKEVGWQVSDVDLFEINEAFAVVAMAAAKELHIPREKLNVNGGACALGHPIGASGARIITTLVYALKHRGLKRGVASLCIGGGEATAIAMEIV